MAKSRDEKAMMSILLTAYFFYSGHPIFGAIATFLIFVDVLMLADKAMKEM